MNFNDLAQGALEEESNLDKALGNIDGATNKSKTKEVADKLFGKTNNQATLKPTVGEFTLPESMLEQDPSTFTKEEFKNFFSSILSSKVYEELSINALTVEKLGTYQGVTNLNQNIYGMLFDKESSENLRSVVTDNVKASSHSEATEKFVGEIINETLRKTAVLANSELAEYHREPEKFKGREREMAVKWDMNMGAFAVSKIFIEAKGKEWVKAAKHEASLAAFEDVPGLSKEEVFADSSKWRTQHQAHILKMPGAETINYYKTIKEDVALHTEYESAKTLKHYMISFRDHVVSGGTAQEKRALGDKIEKIMTNDLLGKFAKEESHALRSVFHTNSSFGLRNLNQISYGLQRELAAEKAKEAEAEVRKGKVSQLDTFLAKNQKPNQSAEKSQQVDQSLNLNRGPGL